MDSFQLGGAAGCNGQTLRLTPDAWRQLKLMTIEQERTAHDLLLEAVSDLFQKYDKPSLS